LRSRMGDSGGVVMVVVYVGGVRCQNNIFVIDHNRTEKRGDST
jgi:hypothetical protein